MKIFRPTYKDKVTGETRQVDHFYLRFKGRRYPLHVTDRRAAEIKARDLINQLELGIDPHRQEKAKREPLDLLVAEFIDRLVPLTGVWHREGLTIRMRKMIREVGASTIPEFTADRIEQWLRRSGLAARSRHHYTQTAKQFGKFLVETGRVSRNPYSVLPSVRNVEADRRIVRRALTEEEIATLLAAVPNSKYERCGMTGPERAVLYKVVLATGLRREETSSLHPASFRLDETLPHIVLAARSTKNRKTAHQPIPAGLAAELRVFLAGRPANRPVFPVSRKTTAHMVKMDLAEAGIPVVVNGQQVDWHALRTTFGTRLARANVPLVMAQKLMRHSTPVLTANIYTVAQLSDLSRELEKLG